jgi:hypothetical protein
VADLHPIVFVDEDVIRAEIVVVEIPVGHPLQDAPHPDDDAGGPRPVEDALVRENFGEARPRRRFFDGVGSRLVSEIGRMEGQDVRRRRCRQEIVSSLELVGTSARIEGGALEDRHEDRSVLFDERSGVRLFTDSGRLSIV